PELAADNARQSDLIALEDSLRRFIGRERNKNAFGLRATVMGAGALTGMLSGHPQTGIGAGLMGAALTAMDVPEMQSSIAIALNNIANTKAGQIAQKFTPTRVLPAAARTALATAQSEPLKAYAKGGVIHKPTLLVDLKTGKPHGIMAEKGPEVIVPLD